MRQAFLDELEKIGTVYGYQTGQSRKDKFKKWVRTSAAMAAGAAAGSAVLTVGDKILSAALKNKWGKVDPTTKLVLLGLGSSAAAVGVNMAAQHALNLKRKLEA